MAESKTTKMDLDRDFNINGRQYEKGKGVEVQADHVDAIKEMQEANQSHLDWATTHHGAVPVSEDPQAATAQTPTRPLGAEHLRMEQSAVDTTKESKPEVVKDPGEEEQTAQK